MPQPMAVCIEDLASASHDPRYVRCVAIAGRQPGLGLDAKGELCWQQAEPLTVELWVSADARLVLYRPAGAAPVRLVRAERALDVPEGKPVIVLSGDQVEIAGRRLRLHVHGIAPAVRAPCPLEPARGGRVGRAVAVMAIGAAVAGCEQPRDARDPVEVREMPPSPPPIDLPPTAEPPPTATDPGSGAEPDAGLPLVQQPSGTGASGPAQPTSRLPEEPPRTTPPIDVREAPPDIMVE